MLETRRVNDMPVQHLVQWVQLGHTSCNVLKKVTDFVKWCIEDQKASPPEWMDICKTPLISD